MIELLAAVDQTMQPTQVFYAFDRPAVRPRTGAPRAHPERLGS